MAFKISISDKIRKYLLKESSGFSAMEIDPGGSTISSDLGGKATLAGGYEGPILVQNPAGAAFDPSDKETRLGMGFQIPVQDYNAARNVAKQYGVDIDRTDRPWQELNKARQNERIQMVKQKGIEMGLISPDSDIETMTISQNANPQTVLDSPINQWLWDTIRNADVAFAKKNQETVQEEIDVSAQPQQATRKTKGKKAPANFSQAMGFKVDPNTEKKIKSTIKQAGIKPSGNVYKDMTAAQNRINIINSYRRSLRGI